MTKTKTLASLSILSLSFPMLCSAAATTPSKPSSSAIAYQSCAKYAQNEVVFDNTAKGIASVTLDGALDELEMMNPPSVQEQQKRDACVLMSLQHGADPNNTKVYSAPLLMAISDKDATAVQLLLQYKANPNVQDDAVTGGTKVTALQRACDSNNEDIPLALVNAGADVVLNTPLWAASANAEPRVVAAMLKTGKIPVSQLTKFSDAFDDAETALDASDSRVDALTKYFSQTAQASASDKLDAANEVIYAYYVTLQNLPTGTNADVVMKDLLQRQSQVSSLLKSAGWTCHQPNCGIDTLSTDDGSGSNAVVIPGDGQ